MQSAFTNGMLQFPAYLHDVKIRLDRQLLANHASIKIITLGTYPDRALTILAYGAKSRLPKTIGSAMIEHMHGSILIIQIGGSINT
jgi:hypothetical protein